MEHAGGRVLPFPVPQAESRPVFQPSLLSQWEVLHLHFTHELLRIQRLGAMMTGGEVLILQGEWSLLAMRLDLIEAAIKFRIAAHAKATGLIA